MGACASICTKKPSNATTRSPLTEEERVRRRENAATAAKARADKNAIKPRSGKQKSYQNNSNDLVSPSMWN